MARTAPAPNAAAPPGMAPGNVIKGGGGAGGGSGGGGAGSGGGGSGGGPGGGADGAGGGSAGAGAGSPDANKYKPCGTKGCPIDVATGRMYTLPEEDLSLPGPLPLVFERQYSSFVRARDTGLGYGWVHSLAWEVEERGFALVVFTDTGTWEEFPKLEVGQEAQGKWGWTLRREKNGYVLDTNEGVWREMAEEAPSQWHGDTINKRYRLTNLYDRNGNRIHLDYQDGALAYITDSVGRTVRVDRTPEGRIAALRVRNAPTRGQWIAFAQYSYDDQGQLVGATDADGFQNRYAYDDQGRHLLVENGYKTGLVFSFRYDREGRCFESWGAYPGQRDPSLATILPTHLSDGQTVIKGVHHVRIEYLPDGFRHVYDSTRLESYGCNEHGLLDMADIGGAVSKATFRDDGWVMTETDPLKGVTVYERDGRGNVTSVTDPLGRKTTYERDPRGLVVKVVDPEGGVTEITRDGRGNVELIRDASGALTSYQRDARGMVTAIVDSRGGTTQLHHDPEANLVAVTLPNGAIWRYAYDAFGQLMSRTDPLSATTHYAYSNRGDLVSERNALNETTRYGYDGDGYLTQLVNPVGAITKLLWGGLHKLCERVDANGHRVRLRYNFEGELLEVENEEGEVHHLDRDINGLLVAERTFDDRHLKYTNDLMGRTVLVANGAGELTELSYDAASQLVARALDDGSAETFTYNLRGELIKATNSTGEFEFERDAVGRIVREAQTVAGTTHWVEVDYDAEGDRVGRRTSLGHTEAVQRDALGARTQTLLDGQHQLSHTNDALGREVARFLPGGGRIETGYDALGRVAARRAMDNTVPLPAPGTMPDWQTPSARGVTVDTHYRYSADGELVESWDKDRGKTEYRYDPIGQLLAMVPDQAKTELFRFDPRGNIYEADPGGPLRVYGKGNRLLRKGDTLYTWDDDGRLVQKRITYPGEDDGEGGARPDDVWRYRWNAAGLLSQVTRPDGAKVRFVYDPFARRMGKGVVPGKRSELTASNTRFVWDGDVLAHEIRVTGRDSGDPVVEERTYLFEDESFEPAAERHGRTRWTHRANNQVGGALAEVDGTGTLTAVMDARAWGGESSKKPHISGIRLQGQYYDSESHLHYQRWRYYDSDLGYFVSTDPARRPPDHAFRFGPNISRWIDPLGLEVKIYTVEHLEPEQPLGIGNELTRNEAIDHVRAGGDVIVTGGKRRDRKCEAKTIAGGAGAGETMFHPSTRSAGHGTLPHHHPIDAQGERMPAHVFIDEPGRSQSPNA